VKFVKVSLSLMII